ncbi:MAG: RHS repeat-associated core domain-containing protein, partial [Terriglobia bacterium]
MTDKYMEAVYTYDNEGKMVSVTYPGDADTSLVGRKYTYTFDSMARPNKLTDDQTTPVDWAKNVSYNQAGQMSQMDYYKAAGQYYSEAKTYNVMLQMTQVRDYYGATDSLNMQYVYSATQNNGQITQAIDAVSGETISYTYDSLKQLITAATTGPQWGLSFSYDGFGNRLSQSVTKGSGPSNSLSVNASTNRITTSGYGYDSNGNLTTMPYGAGSMTLSYDIENRQIQATNTNGTERYAYGIDNRRIYQKTTSGTELVFFYGITGDRLRTYQLLANNAFQVTKTNIYFTGRLIWGDNVSIHIDRLGSVRNTSRFYPFGEEQGSGTIPDKFATYYRDSSTGLDYAWHRYYGITIGRFTTPDPYRGSAKLADPQSWNRYTYVANDPVNRGDISGLDDFTIRVDVIADASPITLQNWDPQFVFGHDRTSDPAFPGSVGYDSEKITVLRRLNIMNDAVTKALLALNNDSCAKLFNLPGNVGSPQTFLMTMTAKGNPYGEIRAAPINGDPRGGFDAVTYKDTDNRVRIDLNSNSEGTFFSSNPPPNRNNLSNEFARAAALIEEVAHAARLLFGQGATT